MTTRRRATRGTIDVYGHLRKRPGDSDRKLNEEPLTSEQASRFADRMYQLRSLSVAMADGWISPEDVSAIVDWLADRP